LKFWISVVIILGPLGLLVRFLSRSADKNTLGRNAIVESIGSLVPLVVALVVSDVIVIRNLATGSHGQQLQLLFFILPLFTAWLLFYSPMLVMAAKRGFGKFLYLSFPHVLVVTFLGLAGIFPVAMPLLDKSLVFSQIISLSPWIVMTWWTITVLGSLVGGLVIFIYERWTVKRGYRSWIIYATQEGEVSTPGLKKIWWWMIISVLALFVGFMAGVMINRIVG
jgi:hypothetical protein